MDNEYSNGKAIPFITYNSITQKFEFNRECENLIKEISGDFSVVSIVGMYRSGKSFLLNKMLLNYSKGFSVGRTINACTKGLWIWSKPLLGYNNEGKTVPVLLLDTEGFGSHDSDFAHDSKIFTLAVLLSSVFIYNSVGVIDENVLDSLGFICNLGKVIGSKTIDFKRNENPTNESNEQFDINSIIDDFFPTLLWVIRDFTLQLLDDDGSSLTASDYLEKVLNFLPKNRSKSSNDVNIRNIEEVENSNKQSVRHTIKTYFKNRECMIMVRPTNSEADLQNLDNLTDDKLRPDFIAQVLSLRKKLFNNCKPKTFNGIKLNSESYLNLIKDYVEVMNSGKLPTIDSIWNNICKYENEKALEEAQNLYEEFIRENIGKKCLDEDDLGKIHEKAKVLSLDAFKRKSLGDVSNLIKKELKKKIDEKLVFFSKLNEEEIKNDIFNYMKNSFNKIEFKLKKNEINSLEDLDNEILQVENKCIDTFPNLRLRAEMILDFKYKVMMFASNYIVSKLLDEKKLLCEKIEQDKLLNQENTNKINSEIQKRNEENKKILIDMNILKEEISLNKEKHLIYENDKERIITGYEEKINKMKDENIKLVTELNEKYYAKEKQFLESEKKLFENREKYEKDKAALDVKIEFLTKNIQELNNKQKEKNTEEEMQLKELMLLNKNSIVNLENRIKELNNLLDESQDKTSELENKLFEKDNLLEMEKIKFDEETLKLIVEKKEIAEKYKNLKFSIENIEMKNLEEINIREKEIENLKELVKTKEEENLQQIKLIEGNFKSNLSKSEKELSMQIQNNQFLEFKCAELSNQISELKTNYDTTIDSFEKKMLEHSENLQEKHKEMQNYFNEVEKKQIEENFEKERNLLMKDIQNQNDKISKQEENYKKIIEDLEKNLKEFKENSEKNRNEISLLQASKRKLEEEKALLQEENNLKYKKFVEDFDRKNEEKDSFYRRDIEIINKSCEDTIANYKSMFENEKNRLDEKIKEEKQKYEKKLKYMQEEYEKKIQEIEKEYKIETENLKDENDELDSNNKNYMIEAENEMRNLNQKIISLEISLKENKEYLSTFQAQFNSNIEKKTESFNLERKELLKKIETLTSESNQKDQELTGLKFKMEQMEKQISEFNNVMKKEKELHEESKNDLSTKLETLKAKNNELSDELNIKKMEHVRESNLLKQQIEFLNKKNDELTKNNDENNYCVDSIIFNTRRELEGEFNQKMDILKKEKEELNNKLLSKKRENRELEQALLKQTCIHEKESGEFKDKVSSMENKIKEICENYKNELDKIFMDMNGMKDDNEQKSNQLKDTIESLREKNQELEKENKMMNVKKSDMKLKIDLLENHLEDNKKCMTELQKKFESIMNSTLGKEKAEKEQMEKDFNEKFNLLEHQFLTTLQKMDEENKMKIMEIAKENKELEDELSNLSKQTTNSMKLNDPVSISNKIHELLKIQDSLRKDKEEKDRKIAELISKHEREKEYYNIKILEYEVKLKSYNGLSTNNYNSHNQYQSPSYNNGKIDPRKSNENYEIEKEKSKWKIEKEKLLNTIENLNVQITKIEKRSENIQKENEQLKNSGAFNSLLTYNTNHNNNNSHHNNINGEEKISQKITLNSKNTSMNDKEILLDNIKKNSQYLNINMINSPLCEPKYPNNKYLNNYNNNYFNNENNDTQEHKNFIEIISPNYSQDKVVKRDSFINKISMNNTSNKFSPFNNNKK